MMNIQWEDLTVAIPLGQWLSEMPQRSWSVTSVSGHFNATLWECVLGDVRVAARAAGRTQDEAMASALEAVERSNAGI